MNEELSTRITLDMLVPLALPEHADNAGTISVGSDRYPVTIVATDGNLHTVRHDEAVVVKGSEQDGSAEYEYFANPKSRLLYFRKGNEVRMNEKTGRWNRTYSSRRLHVGKRAKYYDPHF